MRTTPRSAAAAVGILLTTAALASCAGGAGDAETTAATAAAGGVDLSDVCPATVVVQTDWNPEADHGHLYELVGKGYTVDANQKSVTGDLVAGGKPTGVKIEVRAGGPAIGFTQASAQMYQDTSITLGYVSTDEAVQLSDKFPTTAVFAENDKSPMMVMWDPATYPDVTDIKGLGAALKESGGVIRYFNGAAYMSYLDRLGRARPVGHRRQLRRHPGQLRRRPGQGRAAGLRDRRAVHLRERGHGLGQARQARDHLRRRLPVLPRGHVGPHR